MMYEMLVGYPPFSGKNAQEVYYNITHMNFSNELDHKDFEKISAQAKDLIKKLIEKNPKKRLTAK